MIGDTKESCGHDSSGAVSQPPFGAYAAAHGIMAQVVTLDENPRKRDSLAEWQQLFGAEGTIDQSLHQVLSPWMFQFVVDRLTGKNAGALTTQPLKAEVLDYLLKQFRWQEHESSLGLQFATLDVERAMKKLRKAAGRGSNIRTFWSWSGFRKPMTLSSAATK